MPHKVFIEELRLTAFRNYAEATLQLDQRHVVLTGDNGSGKTNLLEAISFLSPGKGMRRAAYTDVVNDASDSGFSIFARLHGMEGEVEIGTGSETRDEATARRLKINGTQAKSADELTDHLRVAWLTPAMDGLFTGPAGDRRRFLDRLVLSIDPAHGRRASDFERAMRSRNRLLTEGRMDPAWLSGLEQQMAELGIAMALARRDMLGYLAHLIAETQGHSPFPSAGLTLTGFLDHGLERPAAELEEDYAAMLAEGRYRDAGAGRTLDGPHRADLLVFHTEKNMDAARCSTGEQKALLIGLVLAHARLVANMTGHAPLLLLDEIAAHLDEGRRAALFNLIDELGGQAFMTGTDRLLFNALDDRARYFTVAAGKLYG